MIVDLFKKIDLIFISKWFSIKIYSLLRYFCKFKASQCSAGGHLKFFGKQSLSGWNRMANTRFSLSYVWWSLPPRIRNAWESDQVILNIQVLSNMRLQNQVSSRVLCFEILADWLPLWSWGWGEWLDSAENNGDAPNISCISVNLCP